MQLVRNKRVDSLETRESNSDYFFNRILSMFKALTIQHHCGRVRSTKQTNLVVEVSTLRSTSTLRNFDLSTLRVYARAPSTLPGGFFRRDCRVFIHAGLSSRDTLRETRTAMTE